MRIETLIVTVDQHDFSLIGRMNIQTDTIVGNQADFNAVTTAEINNCRVTCLSDTQRGVGRNRNKVLEYAAADYCVFADDDMCFVDGYPEIVEKAFQEAGDADVLVFNLLEREQKRYVNTAFTRVNYRNYGKYGAARYAIRRESIVRAGISFSLLFGGGAKYSAGEDSVFLKECLDKKLKVVAVPYAIAWIDQDAVSTWFTGFHEKYFHDRGALYACLYAGAAPAYCAALLIKHRDKFRKTMPLHKAFHHMLAGIRDYKSTT